MKKILKRLIKMIVCQNNKGAIAMTKNENEKSFSSSSINWLKCILEKSATNPYKSRDL